MGVLDAFRRWRWRRKWSALDVPAEEWALLDAEIETANDLLKNVRSLETLITQAAALRGGHGMNTRTVYRDPSGKEHAVDIVLDGAGATDTLMDGYRREMDARRFEMMNLAVRLSNWAARNAVRGVCEPKPPLPERLAAFVREAARIARELNAARSGRTADEFLRYALLDKDAREKRLQIGRTAERVKLEKSAPAPESEPPKPTKKRTPDKDAQLRREIAKTLPEAFAEFGVDAQFSKFHAGHAVTRYSLKIERGQKFSKVEKLEEEIAGRLGVANVAITRSATESQTVFVDVPNATVTPLYFRDAPRQDCKFFVGESVDGAAVFADMDALCHVLISGTTGSGKSTFLNALICSLLQSSPKECRFVMIDPKMVELTPYNGIPHLEKPVVTDSKEAVETLERVAEAMEKRYRRFAELGVKKLSEHNEKATSPLARMIVVVDELSDLMSASGKEVEESIVRIAQKGRAAGIHLVLATQRPSADVITGLIKANIPSRIAFMVASALESRIILDESGAEKLIGKGDMLYKPNGGKSVRLQGAYLDADEIAEIVARAKKY